MQTDNCDYNYLETILYMSFILLHHDGDPAGILHLHGESAGILHQLGESAGFLIREAKEMKCT